MFKLSQLYPQPLWNIFSKICSIPHPSYHEDKLVSYIMSWMKEKKLHAKRDNFGNILIYKSATAGMENRKLIALQAHLDMVPQKRSDVVHNFVTDPIQPFIQGDWVKAKGTTLGADNGIGVASLLAILIDENIEHGPLEILFTVNEETDMGGALALQSDWIKSSILINTDSEEEGKICIGCASGINFVSTLSLKREIIPNDFKIFKLIMNGLKGGHSGSDIHLNLGNANKLLVRFLVNYAMKLDIRLINFNGGTLKNTIPHTAEVILALSEDKIEQLKLSSNNYLEILKSEFLGKEENLTITLKEISYGRSALTADSRNVFIHLLNATPNGVIFNSDIHKNTVETSLNIAIVNMNEDNAKIICLIRSLTDSGGKYVVNMLKSLNFLANSHVLVENKYPCWQPNTYSPLKELVCNTYQYLFNNKLDIQIIHAGLECGILKNLYPNMDIISLGPTIVNPHSPNEKVSIKSVGRYWKLLVELLKVV